MFTPEELEELRRADAEIEKSFRLTNAEIRASRNLDKEAKRSRMDNHDQKIAAQQAAYYEANKEKIAAQRAAYREANKEKIAAQQAAWIKNNREKWNDYQREYRRRKKAASDGQIGKRQ